MFKIHVVDRSNRHHYAGHLEEYYRVRHQIYVVERGWRDLARPDLREVDAFDTEDAVYLLGICPGKGIVAGSRLVPSLKPHLLGDVFPELAGGLVPRSAETYEWTRVFVIPGMREPGRPSRAAGIVYCGMLEACRMRGIKRLTVVCEPYWQPRLMTMGWNPQPLGEVLHHKDGPVMALLLTLNDDALVQTREFYRIQDSVLANRPPPPEVSGIDNCYGNSSRSFVNTARQKS